MCWLIKVAIISIVMANERDDYPFLANTILTITPIMNQHYPDIHPFISQHYPNNHNCISQHYLVFADKRAIVRRALAKMGRLLE
jgi:hypothetical protein